MTPLSTYTFMLSGALAMGYAVAAVFFLKFWRRTRDPLFANFAAAFAILCVHRIALGAPVSANVDPLWYYVLRLTAFLLILVAIIGKNKRMSS